MTLATRTNRGLPVNVFRCAAVAGAMVAALALGACGERQDGDGKPARQAVSVVLDVPANANHSGLLAGIEGGSFSSAGIDVSTTTAASPTDPLPMVAGGKVDFAISHEPELLIARSRGEDLVAVAAIIQRPLTALMTVRDQAVDPRKLEGSKVGTGGLQFQDAFLDEILSSSGVDTSTVKVSDVGYDFSRAMTRKAVDATLGAYWNIEGTELRQDGRKPRTLPVDREGVPTYNELVLVAREETVRNRGPLVRRFVQALQRGTASVRRNPDLGVSALRKASPKTSRKAAATTVAVTLPLMFPGDGRRPFGWMNPDRWQALSEWMVRRDLLRPGSDPLAALTNEFLPGEGVPPPEN